MDFLSRLLLLALGNCLTALPQSTLFDPHCARPKEVYGRWETVSVDVSNSFQNVSNSLQDDADLFISVLRAYTRTKHAWLSGGIGPLEQDMNSSACVRDLVKTVQIQTEIRPCPKRENVFRCHVQGRAFPLEKFGFAVEAAHVHNNSCPQYLKWFDEMPQPFNSSGRAVLTIDLTITNNQVAYVDFDAYLAPICQLRHGDICLTTIVAVNLLIVYGRAVNGCNNV